MISQYTFGGQSRGLSPAVALLLVLLTGGVITAIVLGATSRGTTNKYYETSENATSIYSSAISSFDKIDDAGVLSQLREDGFAIYVSVYFTSNTTNVPNITNSSDPLPYRLVEANAFVGPPGPTGATGPQGATGATGPEGPPGEAPHSISNVAGTNTLSMQGTDMIVEMEDNGQVRLVNNDGPVTLSFQPRDGFAVNIVAPGNATEPVTIKIPLQGGDENDVLKLGPNNQLFFGPVPASTPEFGVTNAFSYSVSGAMSGGVDFQTILTDRLMFFFLDVYGVNANMANVGFAIGARLQAGLAFMYPEYTTHGALVLFDTANTAYYNCVIRVPSRYTRGDVLVYRIGADFPAGAQLSGSTSMTWRYGADA